MELIGLLQSTLTYIVLWVSTVVIIVLYIRLGWSRRLARMEKFIRECDYRLATIEAKIIRTQEEVRELKNGQRSS